MTEDQVAAGRVRAERAPCEHHSGGWNGEECDRESGGVVRAGSAGSVPLLDVASERRVVRFALSRRWVRPAGCGGVRDWEG